jgi:hypothetical protein
MPHGMSWERYLQYCDERRVERLFWKPIIDEQNRRFYLEYERRIKQCKSEEKWKRFIERQPFPQMDEVEILEANIRRR